MKLSRSEKIPRIVLEKKEIKPNRSSLKHLVKVGLLTFVFTFFLGATFHLALVSVLALIRSDSSLLNPIEFLGLHYLFPSLAESSTALLLSWLVLVVVYWIVYRLLTSFDKISAVWYTSDTYEKIGSISKLIKKLSENSKSSYHIKKFLSFYFLTKDD